MSKPRSSNTAPMAAQRSLGAEPSFIATPVRTLLRGAPVTMGPDTPIRDAAVLMRDQRTSAVLIVEHEQLVGIVTHRDLSNRVIAADLATDHPIHEIATAAPATIELNATAFDALLLMARLNIHHVPVMDGTKVVGMLSAADLTQQHSSSAVFLAGDIYKQDDIEGLQRASGRLRDLQRHLAAADASAYATGHISTAITDALTIRILQLAEIRFGPPPVDYAWVAAGSQARSEQTAKSDQDNCLVLNDAYDERQHGEYFESLSRFVCGGLDACGYVYCPGEMMAMNTTWRQPLQQWKQYFQHWINAPEPKALMLTCVFFDLRLVHGSAALLTALRRDVLQATRGNVLFLAHMVGNALKQRPPLGLLGRITVDRSGEHRGKIDLKHQGIVPIVDLARIYALAGGHDAVNTHDRLEVAAQSREVSEQSAHDLRDALEYLAVTRIRHQDRQMIAAQPIDNFLSLGEVSNFERTQLKEAFAVVQTLQSVLRQRYRAVGF